MSVDVRLCLGMGLRACHDCLRAIDNHPDESSTLSLIQPRTSDTRCADWLPIPHAALDASHGRL